MNGRIPTGEMPYGDNTETTPIEGQTDPNGDRPYNPYEHDPNGLFTPPTTTPNNENPTNPDPDPNIQPTDPVTPDPNIQPTDPVNPDPGNVTPDPGNVTPDEGGEQTPAGN